MFKIIKEKIDIIEVMSKELGIAFKKAGDNTFEPEDKTCPFCGHRECFKVKSTGEETDFYHCFSCEVHGDVITFIEKSRDIRPIDAARALAKEWKVTLPNDYTPIQEIFNLAAEYYHNCFLNTCNKPYAELNALTPMEYQVTVRKHKPETMKEFLVGWSDGSLITYLRGLGYEEELLLQSGLMNSKFRDFLPSKSFIYPHFVIGRTSHFTFKDPLKQHAYQIKNSHKLNSHIFYNSDSLRNCETVAIVEGENDLLSLHENGWSQGLIATIGQISSQQLEWIENNLKGKHVITFFDPDQAGDKYREKLGALKSTFASLKQIRPPEGKDIDKYLSEQGNLQTLIGNNNVQVELPDVEEETEEESSAQINIVEKGGAYYKMKYREGLPTPSKMTNFTIRLKNIFIKGAEREREVVLVREDGTESGPVTVSSECKVSLKPFKSFVANTIDGSFYGSENDLIAMWEYVYSKGVEKLVYVPTTVGRLEEHKGWLFRDLFVSDTGQVIRPDEEGIVWFSGKTTGLKAMSLNVGQNGKSREDAIDIPVLTSTIPEAENNELLKNVLLNLCKNLGDVGMALTIMGWTKANVYSNLMFKKVQGFPFLFFWGKHGQGKTVIAKWIAAIYNMDESGYATLPQLRSGVGFGRKIAYYSSLPVIMDEIRADGATIEQYGTIRSWYQRSGRSLGTKEGVGWKEQQGKV
jgi:5S rRNA maturation endonuclease (ribonuclease M5)